MNLYRASLVGVAAVAFSLGASAQAIHGFCSDCSDTTIGGSEVMGTNTLMNFGFWSGPGLTGSYTIDILTPDNLAPAASYLIQHDASSTATLFKTTPWTSGFLGAYLGINAKPNNPIDNWLPGTQVLQSAATGYFVYQVNLGTDTLGKSSGTGPLLNLGSALPAGSLIVGFLDAGKNHVSATANSDALFEMGAGTVTVPEPGTAALIAVAMFGYGVRLLRRRASRLLLAC